MMQLVLFKRSLRLPCGELIRPGSEGIGVQTEARSAGQALLWSSRMMRKKLQLQMALTLLSATFSSYPQVR